MQSLSDPRKRPLTPREQRKAILDRLDTVQQAMRQVKAKSSGSPFQDAIAALVSVINAQKIIEATIRRDAS